MAYDFEAELIEKLKLYNEISTQISILEDKKVKTRDQIKKWLAMNNIEKEVTISTEEKSWTIKLLSSTRRSVIDMDVLTNKLGNEASVFIKESESESLRITTK